MPFAQSAPTAQTFRKVFRLMDPVALENGFASWAASLPSIDWRGRDVVAIDGKTARGSKTAPDGTGTLHLISAYASEAGLALAQRTVNEKSNEIMVIPALLDMLVLDGANASIDAVGAETEIARALMIVFKPFFHSKAFRTRWVLPVVGSQGRGRSRRHRPFWPS